MISARSHLDRFYAALTRLESATNQGLSLERLVATKCLPEQGVYFFREPGETTSDLLGVPRIVRVGTHAVSLGSKATLRSRLKAHLGGRSGLGNHRGSIFRLHVGDSIARMDGAPLPTWGGSKAPPELLSNPLAREAEAAMERRISERIGKMTVLWLSVPDEASPTSLRAVIEQNSIALLSNRRFPIEPASSTWLGFHSHRDEIRGSGLWNIKHVDETYDPNFFSALDLAVDHTLGM